MKFRVSITGGNNNTSNNPFGGLGNILVPSVAMNFVSNGENKNPISSAMGGLTQQGGVILSSDEILEVSYSTNPIYGVNYGDEKSTRDVMVQTDLGGGKTFELYFPKMYVENFNQDFSVRSGEGYFILKLKQTGFNEDNNTLK